MNTYRFLSLLSFSLFLFACGASKKTASTPEPTKPDWVMSRPIDAGYYIGIGVANKMQFPLNYHEEAKRQALNELASEIEVNVNSNSMLFSLEQNGELKEEFKSFTKLTTNTSIKNFEQVDAFETSTDYYLFYRLSKAQYKADKQAAIDKAISESVVAYEEGVAQEARENYREALQLYMQALNPVAPYLNEQLKTTYKGNEVYWGSELMKAIGELTLSMKLNPTRSSVKTSWGHSFSSTELGFELRKNGKPVKNMPVRFSYTEGYIRPRLVVTDAAGMAFAGLGKLRSLNATQHIEATLSLRTVYEEIEGDKDAFVADLVEGLQGPPARLAIKVEAPAVYVEVNCTALGKQVGSEALTSSLKDALVKKGYKLVSGSKEARLTAKLNLEVRIVSENSGRFTAAAEGSFSVTDAETNGEVHMQRISGVRGVQLSDVAAADKVLEKVSEEIEMRWVPQFHRAFLK